MTLVAGIDSSTQSCKVVIIDADTREVVREGRSPHPLGTEVDPTAWWVALTTAIADAGGFDDVAAWSIGGQQHGMVALDRAGRVVRPALLWNDTRSADAARELIEEIGADVLAQRTGLVPVASFTITKLRWLRDNEPDAAERTQAVALPHDWLTWRLRGYGPVGESPEGPQLDEIVTDRSDASGTGYWNPSTGQYEMALAAHALGRSVHLPRILGPTESVRDSAGRVVGPGAGDNAAAALGLDASTGDAVVSIGTSGTVFAVADERTTDPSGTVAGFADATGRFLPIVVTLNAARVADTVAALLDVDHDELSRLALTAAPGAGGLSLLPYFEGERTPDLPHATATLSGMTLSSFTRANLARAAYEGMLGGLRVGIDALRDIGVHPKRALLIGGGARSRAVRAIAPDIFGIPVEVPAPREYVALGAAYQAARSLAAV